jgi:hypoxanthine phosphoribosyltransferase
MEHNPLPTQNKRIYTWDSFDKDVELVLTWLKQKNLDIKCVYGVPKGGLVLAVTLANKLNVPLEVDIEELNCYYNEQILVVDDISDSGETLKLIPDIDKYNTVTLFIKEQTTFIPDFYCNKDKNNWIVFPWE